MTTTIALGGNGHWGGGEGEIVNYTVDEEATPLHAADTSGAVPQISFEVDESLDPDETLLLYGSPITLSDGSNGTTFGTITDVSPTNGLVSISAESPLASLVPEQQIKPFVGSLRAAVGALLHDVEVDVPIAFDPELAADSSTVAMQGWYGSPWEWLKMMGISHGFEVSIIGEAIAVRTPRARETDTSTDSSRAATVSRGQMALNIEVVRYRHTYREQAMVYPAEGWTEDLEVYTVDADEKLEVEIPINVSLMSIEQPICVSMLSRDYVGPSAYTVSGNDGLPITPATWAMFGGALSVEIGQDTKTLILKITGPSLQKYAPYSISVNSGLSDTYSTLRIRGTGVHFTREVHRYATGASSKIARQEVGVTIDNPTVQSDDQFAALVLSAARAFSMPTHTISAVATVANRSGRPGLVRYLTFGDFKAARSPSYTLASWKDEFSTRTFREIRDQLRAEGSPRTSFENQAFGNVIGSITRRGSSYFRVRRATIEPSGISWEAEADTTFGQIKEAHAGKTFRELMRDRAGLTFAEIALTPLREIPPLPEPEVVGFGSGVFGGGRFGHADPPISDGFGLDAFGTDPFGG